MSIVMYTSFFVSLIHSHFAVEMCHATGVLIPLLEENQISIPTSNENIETDRSKLDEQMDNVISSDTQLLKSSTNSDLPAPEKLLSMPEGLIDPPNDLLVELTPDKVLEGSEEDGAAMKNISGKKRSFTESTLTVHSLNSVETFGVSKWRKTAESIPDDDDLLSSILGIKLVSYAFVGCVHGSACS